MWYNILINNKGFEMTFGNLFSRWLDEKEYEDINQYKEVIVSAVKKVLPNLVMSDIKPTKRPFGITFSTEDGKRWRIFHNMREFGVKRIG